MAERRVADLRAHLAEVEQRGDPATFPADTAAQLVFPLATELLEYEGYVVGPADSLGLVNAIATLPPTSTRQQVRVGLIYAHYGTDGRRGPNWIRQLTMAVKSGAIDRGMLVTNGQIVLDPEIANDFPVEIGVLDWAGLRAAVGRVRETDAGPPSSSLSHVKQAVVEFNRRVAEAVAENPAELDDVEWRDLERMMADVFTAFGFAVELTPSTKDGGRDILLRGHEEGRPFSYAVEIKHWRSSKRVGPGYVRSFMEVVVREGHDRGLYLSTSGYSRPAVEALMTMDRHRIALQGSEQIVGYCDLFVRHLSGLWSAPTRLSDILFGATRDASSP